MLCAPVGFGRGGLLGLGYGNRAHNGLDARGVVDSPQLVGAAPLTAHTSDEAVDDANLVRSGVALRFIHNRRRAAAQRLNLGAQLLHLGVVLAYQSRPRAQRG